jgi:pimeloyl-ACP methyl ester carboxylesterase
MPRRVADVVAVLDALGIERANIVGLSGGGRLAFGIGEHAPERVRSLVIVGQQPYAIDPDGPLARAVGDALEASRVQGIEALVRAFEAVVGRYPEPVRTAYLACDAEAMRAAFAAAMGEGAVSERLGEWSLPCLICVAGDDTDFFAQGVRAAQEIPGAAFISIEGTDHLGMDTASVDPVLDAIVGTLRRAS